MSTFSQAAAAAKNYGSVSKVSAAPTRSSAPNAAAAAASARISSGNLGKSTPSGVGNQIGGGGNGGEKNTSFRTTPNAAAANANRIASLNMAGPTQTGGGKTNFGGNPSPIQRGLAALGFGSPTPSMTPKPNGIAAYNGLRNMVTPYQASPAAIVAGGATPAMAGDFSKTWGFTPEMYTNPATNAAGFLDGGGLYGYPKAAKDQSRVPQSSQPSKVSSALTGAQDYNPLTSMRPGQPSAPVSTAEMSAKAFSPPLAGNGIPGDPSANRQPVIGEVNPADITGRKAPVKLSDVPPVPVRGSTARPGVNFSSGDYLMAGYGAYNNPRARIVGQQPSAVAQAAPRQLSPAQGQPYNYGPVYAPNIPTQVAQDDSGIAARAWPNIPARPQIGGVKVVSPASAPATQDAGNGGFLDDPLGYLKSGYDTTVAGLQDTGKKLQGMVKQVPGKTPQDQGGAASGGPNPAVANVDDPSKPGYRGSSQNEKRRKRIADALTGNGTGTGTGTGGNTTLPPWFLWKQWPVGPRPSNV